jgi:ubiquinone/menaquinone biosynthesis C-methylase UbiE
LKRKNKVCPVELSGTLDIGLRKLFHNPSKMLGAHVKTGMSVLDLGCGPGFFTIELARMVGGLGKVIAADLQEGMLEKIKRKTLNSNAQKIIELHKCQDDKIGVSNKVDFILVFYMLHEVPDQFKLMQELKTLLKPEGIIYISEPKFHVSKNEFSKSQSLMKKAGFEIIDEPKVAFSRTVVLKNKNAGA